MFNNLINTLTDRSVVESVDLDKFKAHRISRRARERRKNRGRNERNPFFTVVFFFFFLWGGGGGGGGGGSLRSQEANLAFFVHKNTAIS
jgi:hypothetical protein